MIDRPSPLRWYVLEGCNSIAATLLTSGVFFYTKHELGWSATQNLLLAVGQGLFYVVGALFSHGVDRRLGPLAALRGLWGLCVLIALLPLLSANPVLLCAALLVYSMVTAGTWPMLESLVTTGVDATHMSRRIGLYNLTWAGTGALTIAFSGLLLEYWPAGFFVLPLALHAASAALVGGPLPAGRPAPAADATHALPVFALPVDRELLAVRNLALWLSRICLPATYVAIVSLMALYPTLPAIQDLSPWGQTLLTSVWLASRWVAFLALGHMVWWHGRPRLLLVAAVVLTMGFVGITLPPSAWGVGAVGSPLDLWAMVGWQVLFGAALGLIYAASLYFGMVLSDGSTEHGGYHEALIGLGQALGPGMAALGAWITHPASAPANAAPASPLASVIGATAVLMASLVAAGVASVRLGRRIGTLEHAITDPTAPDFVIRND